MKTALTLLAFLGIVSLSCGFVESSRIIKVKKDGSGEILVRVLYNPKHLEEGEKYHNPEVLKATPYGMGVQFIVSTECKDEKTGWVGYLAKYTFADVNDIRIFPASIPRAATVGADDVIYKSGWRFSTGKKKAAAPTEGDEFDEEVEEAAPEPEVVEAPAEPGAFKLEIIPLFTDFEPEGDDGFVDGEEEELVVEEDLEMKLLQKGRRYVTYIQFLDEIDKENTTVPENYFSKTVENTVVLNDEQFDVMWSKPAARERILQEEPDFAGYGVSPEETNGYRAILKRSHVTLK